MNSKRAQSEIITTVLIILLVLAAIIIVWQVVQGTVTKGADTASTQANCIGVGFDVTPLGDDGGTNFIVKRQATGDVFNNSLTFAVLVNGITADTGTAASSSTYAYSFANGATATDFKDPLVSRTINITKNASSVNKVEVALKVNGNVCGAEGIWTP